MTMRPYSIIPKISSTNTGATTANSTAAAPRCFRSDRDILCTLFTYPLNLDGTCPLCRDGPVLLASHSGDSIDVIQAFPSRRNTELTQWRLESHKGAVSW